MFRSLRLVSAASAALVLLAACGSSRDSSSTTTSSSTSTTTAATSSTTSAAEAEPTLAGYRGLTWGMSLNQATTALGQEVTAEDPTCGTATYAGEPDGITLWWVDGKIVEAEVGGSQTVAGGRLHIGSTEAEVRTALGSDVASELSDDQTRTDLVYRTAATATAGDEMRFIITDGKVSDIAVGLRHYVELQELCG
jgi:hypothetical protein